MKKFISGLLGILFVVLVVVGVFICTYVFNQPSRSGDSRELISGTWTDKDANITFEFSDEGDFTITHADDKSVIAKGWFKIEDMKNENVDMPDQGINGFDFEWKD